MKHPVERLIAAAKQLIDESYLDARERSPADKFPGKELCYTTKDAVCELFYALQSYEEEQRYRGSPIVPIGQRP